MKKIIIGIIISITAAALLLGCAATDVVLKYSETSLQSILKAYPNISTVSDKDYAVLTVDNQTKLKAAHDFKLTAEDILIETPLKPFLDAGLDTLKLPAGFKADESNLYVVSDYGNGAGLNENIADAIFDAIKYDRKALSYHTELDHYGIALSQGKFEWANDYTKNDKDLVFVIAAKPLLDIGVDVQNIEGWVFKTMQDEAGNDMELLLKPYDLN